MKKKALIFVVLGVAVVLISAGVLAYMYFAPSNVKREMSKQYHLQKDEAMIVINDTVLKETGIVRNGQYYLPMDIVSDQMNDRLFYDNYEQKLCYVTPNEVIQVPMDSNTYQSGKSTKQVNYNILIQNGNKVYIALPFVETYSAIEVKNYKNPARVVARTNFTTEYSIATLDGTSRLRVGPNKKYDYLLEVEKGKKVIVNQAVKEANGYKKVMTEDGIVGYLPTDSFKTVAKEKWVTKKTEPVFEQATSDKKICLGWHQATSQAANGYLGSLIANAKGINVVSPTWFALSDNNGNFTSLANTNYVTQAHNAGLKVWGLVNDFNKNVNLEKLLVTTTTRQQLVNNLVAAAIQNDLDGINIDFERIKQNSSKGFLEFLRELSVKCKSNQLILSVDNYMPASFNQHYGYEEQGKVVDYVILMGYDEHYAGSESGSVSSISYVQNGVDSLLKMVPSNRVVVGLPFFTRLWKEKGGQTTSTAYGMDTAENIVKSNNVMAKWDDATKQYFATWKKSGATYKIWLEEEKSLGEKLKVTSEKNVAGVAFWKLGFERPGAWNVISKSVQ